MAKKPPVRSIFKAETQDEALAIAKDWLKENGMSIVIGLVLGIVGVGGWKGWQNYQDNHFNQAAELYLSYVEDRQGNAANFETLVSEYDNTPYIDLARLYRAAQLVEEDALDEARADLLWVVEHSAEKGLATIAKMREVRILLTQKKYQEALDELNSFAYGSGADSLAEELRGDALVGLGLQKDATAAYKKALDKQLLPLSKEMIQVKLSRLKG